MLAAALSVACVCGSSLVALRWVIAHREKSFANAPIAEMQRRLDEIQNQMTSNALGRR